MKKGLHISIMAAATSLLFAAGGIAAETMSDQSQQQQAMQQQQEQYARQLLTLEKLEGMKIQNQQGEKIGTVDRVVLDTQDGKIAYVVVTSGGFWGIGGEKAIVPWKAVKMQQTGPQQAKAQEQVLVLNVTREQLKNAPHGDIQDILDRRQAQEIHQHYGVAPYWEESPSQRLDQMRQQKKIHKEQ